ncbi:uncharacterized protein LOC119663594 [Teleopsis dalmanni]|uniref:uncharacterized protein LOC119663594 n=1 Tax=Teleopsis dalmanni TaxID=139649 RepID=UPI0018CF755A|nr:uncharacterized protein LOC119663594 [Teleopsis dalmanni]
MWFTGPQFLLHDEEHWPPNNLDNIDMEEITKEKRRSTFAIEKNEKYILDVISKCSSFNKILRIISYVQHFYHITNKRIGYSINSNSLSPQELEKALHCIVWVIQQHYFAEDVQRLLKKKSIEGALKYLNPFFEETSGYNLLKVGGRLELSDIPIGQRHPILLIPKNCTFVKLYVHHLHLSNYHAGSNFGLLTLVTLLARCYEGGAHRSGLRWLLSTNAFIAALKRLIGRRGLPAEIYCDNATNFVGASNKLLDLKKFLFDKSNQTILQRAPHFGGLWEAAVKSAKGHLNRTLVNTRLTFEELGRALVEIEAVLNSRPITPLSCDPNDYEALTPAHFLKGSTLKALPELTPIDENIEPTDRWARITAVKYYFWRKWSKDYLNELQVRTKWTAESPNVTTGALVLIHEDNTPPQRWPMGRNINCITGPDNLVRVVDVQTSKGIIRRPIHKLAVLPS